MTTAKRSNSKWAASAARTKRLTMMAMLIAIELMMWLLHLGQVPMGPLNMSFLTVPVAVGAILCGPSMGAAVGAAFGATSFYDAVTGASVMTHFFFEQNWFLTLLLCVGTRALMGWCTGLIFQTLRLPDKKAGRRPAIWKYYAGALAAPLLNTLFFMGYIVLVFYRTSFVQSLVAAKSGVLPWMIVTSRGVLTGISPFVGQDLSGADVIQLLLKRHQAVSPLRFVVLLVGVQGLIEAVVCTAVGGSVAKGVAYAVYKE